MGLPMWRVALMVLAIILLGVFPSLAHVQDKAIGLKVMQHPALESFIEQNRGKVVMLYLWANYSPPDKVLFPRIVRMHRQFGEKGFVTASVCIDDLSEMGAETKARILRFLRHENATFDNFVLEGDPRTTMDKLQLATEGAFLIVDRKGRRHRFDRTVDGWDLGTVDRLIGRLVRE